MLNYRFTGLVIRPNSLLAVTIVSSRQRWSIESINEQEITGEGGLKLAFNKLKKQLPRWFNRYAHSLILDEVLYKQTRLQPPIHPALVELEIDKQLSGLIHQKALNHDYILSSMDMRELLHLFMCKRETLTRVCEQLPVSIVGWHLTDLIALNQEMSLIGHYAIPQWIIEVTDERLHLVSCELVEGGKVFDFSQCGIEVATEQLIDYLASFSTHNQSVAVVGASKNKSQLMNRLDHFDLKHIVDLSTVNLDTKDDFAFDEHYLALACALSARAWHQVYHD